jgi:hypothetical protein
MKRAVRSVSASVASLYDGGRKTRRYAEAGLQARLTERARQPLDTKQRERNAGRKQRIDESRRRREHGPSFARAVSGAIRMRGIHVNDRIGRALANCVAIDGYASQSLCHAGSPSPSFSSSRANPRPPLLRSSLRCRSAGPTSIRRRIRDAALHRPIGYGTRDSGFEARKSSSSSQRGTSVKCEKSACVGGISREAAVGDAKSLAQNPRGPDASTMNCARCERSDLAALLVSSGYPCWLPLDAIELDESWIFTAERNRFVSPETDRRRCAASACLTNSSFGLAATSS